MARLFDDANPDYISDLTAAPITGFPCTIAAWMRSDDDTINQYIVQIQNQSSQGNRFGIRYRGGYAGKASGAFASSDTFSESAGPSSLSGGDWHHVLGLFASATSRTSYSDGSVGTENTTSESPTGIDSISIGYGQDSTPADPFSGDIAEVAVWNVALTQAEISALAAGFSPLLIRPGSLIFYTPLIRDYGDVMGSTTLSASGTTVSDHPRIIRPTIQQIREFAPAAAAEPESIPPGMIAGAS